MTLLLKLILAHLIGDFFLQSKAQVEQKTRAKLRAPAFYLHIAIHTVAVLLLVGYEHWPIAAAVGATHLVIDACKLIFQTPPTRVRWFFLDQGLHLIAILAIVDYFGGPMKIALPHHWSAALVAALFLTRPAAFFVGVAMARWSAYIVDEDGKQSALPNAGLYIGILERLMIFAFIVLGQWAAIGFLMAAKSIFRFGDLTRAKDRRLTEYILIGTFLSFGIALAVGMLYRYFAAQAAL